MAYDKIIPLRSRLDYMLNEEKFRCLIILFRIIFSFSPKFSESCQI